MVAATTINTETALTSVSVYLSYAHDDERDVELIRSLLLESGIEVRPTSPMPGSSWAQHYRQELLRADAVLAILTEHYRTASFVFAELAEAIDANKPIIPLLLSKTADIPAVLRPYQLLDLTESDNHQERLQELISRLRTRAVGERIDWNEELAKVSVQELLLHQEEEAQHQAKDYVLAAATGAAGVIAGGAAVGSLAAATTIASGAALGSAILPVIGTIAGAFGGVIVGYYQSRRSSDKPRSKRRG